MVNPLLFIEQSAIQESEVDFPGSDPRAPGSLSGAWEGYAESQVPMYVKPAAIQAPLQPSSAASPSVDNAPNYEQPVYAKQQAGHEYAPLFFPARPAAPPSSHAEKSKDLYIAVKPS